MDNNGLPNLGPVSMGWLEELGVVTLEDLRRVGSIPVFLEVKRRHTGVSLNLLWALEGALLGCSWKDVPEERKRALREEVGGW